MDEYSGELPVLYDSVPAYSARRDVQFYVDEARSSGGPVLEVGCGTGRVLLPIARSGSTIDGLDASEAMLQRCAENLAREPDDVKRRVKLHRADARAFHLGARFDLVIAPFRVLQHLITGDDQLAFLASVARHLAPNGRLVFDVFNPNFAAMVGADGTEREDTPEQTLSDGGTLRRAGRVKRVRWTEQVSEVELIYYVRRNRAESERRLVQSFDMRWYVRAELVHLLERGGFAVQSLYGDFDRSPLTDASPEMIVVGVRQ